MPAARAPMPAPQNYETSTGRRGAMPAPQMIETPAMRRSAMLAKLLEEQRQPVEIKGGYGELAARLLGQGITQWGANRADKAVRQERDQRFEGQLANVNELVAGLRQSSGRGETPAPEAGATAPMPTPMPVTVPMPNEPVSTGPVAPVGGVMGSRLPDVGQPIPPANVPPATPVPPVETPTPSTLENALLFGALPAQPSQVAPAPQMAAPSVPQPAINTQGMTPGQETRLKRIIELARTTRDPALLAYAQAEADSIYQRMNAAPEWQDVSVNGVPFLRDQFGNMRPAFPNGLPESVMTQDEFNPQGTRRGTYGQRDRFGNLNIIEGPPVGFEARGEGGGLQPISGGPSDPRTGGNRIQNERELRREFRTATEEYRTVRQAFMKVESSLAQQTGIGDVGGIFGTMKIFDPPSTVREGEFATAQNAGGVPERIRGLYNQVLNGQRLTPQQREEMLAVGRAQYSTYEQGYQSRVADFTRMAEDYGIDPRNVVGGDEAPAPGGGSPPRITTQAQYNELASGAPYIDPNGVRRTKQ